MAAELNSVQAREATLASETNKGHAKLKAAQANTAQDEAKLNYAKKTYESQKNQEKYLEDQLADAKKLGDDARATSLLPSIAQTKKYVEQSKEVFDSAQTAVDEAKGAEEKAAEITVVNDEMAQEKMKKQIKMSQEQKLAAMKNVSDANAAVELAQTNKDEVLQVINSL